MIYPASGPTFTEEEFDAAMQALISNPLVGSYVYCAKHGKQDAPFVCPCCTANETTALPGIEIVGLRPGSYTVEREAGRIIIRPILESPYSSYLAEGHEF